MKKLKENCTARRGFGKRLRTARKDMNLNQTALAQKLGLKRGGSISKIETGDSYVSIEHLCKLTKILNVDLHFLITGEQASAILQSENGRLKIISSYAKLLGTLLGDCIRGSEAEAKELEECKKRLAKGEFIEPGLIESLESKGRVYDNKKQFLVENLNVFYDLMI